ncbi:two-component system sensor histidine kinase LytS [Anaerosolibacter carboniphilus]|uniref:histidine kinase n=1 Tax=Anaerosolibacter carboniphilus TaxID=1417629 RepID=A0A841L3L9_9FIRM|nr:LytS/YhcK type 5TM receptor domain-containing protein [Anaerosolibacter carboniphilus]MBB6217732.1 two-component system sensor histidine kinase LytS [Anaerosolibacter carboniphilus]
MEVSKIVVALTDKISVILVVAFLLSKTKLFRMTLVKSKFMIKDKFFLTIIFSIFGIIGTYFGIPIHNAIANSSMTVVAAAGLLGGLVVGIGTSLIVGIYRLYMGGYVAFASAITTLLAGIVSGMLNQHFLKQKKKGTYGFIVGLSSQILLFGMILLFAKPFEAAWTLVKIIALPMMAVNSFGVAIFISILDNIYQEQDRISAKAAQLALEIANKTLPYLKHGLDFNSAQRAGEIIYQMVDHISAVAITKEDTILTHVGLGIDHHKPKDHIMNRSTRAVLEMGIYGVLQNRKEIGCSCRDCKLMAAVTVPLKMKEEIIGTLVLYKEIENSITDVDIQLALGLAQLFSTQLEISEADEKIRLLEKAELKALQAQINPHFLFNAINTIISYTRTDIAIARKLLLDLGHYFRNNLQKVDEFIDFYDEIKNVQSYLAIEEARFSHRLKVNYDIGQDIRCQLPPLIIQPIVENAVKHGLLPRKEGGTIQIIASQNEMGTHIAIEDDGMGMDEEKIKNILDENCNNSGIGIRNVDRRLKKIYGITCGLSMMSEIGKGTKVHFMIPRDE